ncbi:MAG: EAL domain-containing protein [Rhodanobacteraceae bacterium]
MMQNTEQKPENSLLIVNDESSGDEPPAHVWKILIIDDDEDVHQATRFALRNVTILGRRIELLHAHSAVEAKQHVAESDDIAVALVDVVMETPHAGLELVRYLRQSGFKEMRIILRTGQPGYAPEFAVIAEFEIDDYRTKLELTRTRLMTVLTTAIRAYDQIRKIMRSRAGLEMIVQSAHELFQRTNLELFSHGVLTQIAGLLRVAPNGVACVCALRARGQCEGRVVSATGRFSHYLGQPLNAIDDKEILQLLSEAHATTAPLVRNRYLALCFHHESGDDLAVVVETTGDVDTEDLTLLKLFSTNITVGFENLTLLEMLDRLAYLDPVLGVPNFNAFERALAASRASGEKNACMALVSVDAFQAIVATYGQHVANGFLGALHNALTVGSQGNLTIARIGDGSFALLGDHAMLDAYLVSDTFAQPHQIEGIDIAATATAVILDLDDTETDTASILQMASAALLHVSQTQPGKCVTYDTAMRADVERRMAIQVALKETIQSGEGFTVHLQPKVNMTSGEVVGAEALLRWTYQDYQMPPAEFIPIAEASGLTRYLTDFVIDVVGQWVKGRAGKKIVPVAINLSVTDLNSPGFAQALRGQVSVAGLSPETVEFEVTEGIAMQGESRIVEQLGLLKSAGFRIALDDFGTGHSSLGRFDRLPIDTVKIDQAFVAPLDKRNASNSIAAIVVAMTRALRVDCVAEGVETIAQKEALLALGCTIGQGYLLGRPIHLEEFDSKFLPD